MKRKQVRKLSFPDLPDFLTPWMLTIAIHNKD